ncbi:MAG: PilW family protein [Gammaproteobacteria bacterium]|nr:PilW family protein [Gammaproteobacteria bacterium]
MNAPVERRRLPPHGQGGLSLVELLVALALSLFLIAGVVTMYFSSFQSYRVQQQNATLAQRERLAATFVGSVVQSAGYFNQPELYTRATAFPASAAFAMAGQSFVGTDAAYAGGDNDSLSLRMLPSPGDKVLNCLGKQNNTGAPQLYINTLHLDTVAQELECMVMAPGGSSQNQPILSDVTSLNFVYGVDTDGDSSADRYLGAGAVSDWMAVRSITMTIGFATNNAATGVGNTTGPTVFFTASFPVRITSQ